MFSPKIALALRARHHDVVSVSEHPQWRALSDVAVMGVGRREGRAVLTSNLRDYRPLHHALIAPGGNGHAGVIFVASTWSTRKADIGALVSAIEALLQRYPAETALANAEAWL